MQARFDKTNPANAAKLDAADALGRLADDAGMSLIDLALGFVLAHPAVTAPIIGATRLGHITDALAASQLTLSDEEVTRLEQPYAPHPVLGHG